MVMTVQNAPTIHWNAKGAELVAQNVCNLISTYRYEVAYNRLMGIDPALIDRPTNYIIAQLQMDVRELIARFEPRAQVTAVNITATDGDIQIEVVIEA